MVLFRDVIRKVFAVIPRILEKDLINIMAKQLKKGVYHASNRNQHLCQYGTRVP